LRGPNFLLLLILVFLGACADPRYVDGTEGFIDGVRGQCALEFKREALCLEIQWTELPRESTYGKMLLTFVDRTDPSRRVDPLATPHVLLWMPSMGHGSAPVKLERLDVGTFLASEIFFIMPGPWDIRYQLKDGSNVIEEQIQKVTI